MEDSAATSASSRPNARAQALLALALLLPAPILGPALMLFVFPGAVGTALAFVCKLWTLLLPWVWLVKVDRQPVAIARPSRLELVVGAASGLAIAAFMLGVFALVHDWIDLEPLRRKGAETGFDQPVKMLAIFAYIILANSLLEEYVWRWFVVSKLEAALPASGGAWRSAGAVIASGLLFTIHHVLSLAAWVDWRLNALASFGVCLGGWIWSALYLRFRSVWPGYVSHVFADLAILRMAWILFFQDGR